MSHRASILVGLLWCLALLSLIVIGGLHTSRMDLFVGKNYGDKIQARYLALAGIEKAKALLYHDARERSRSRKNHDGNFYDDAQAFRDVPLGRGVFRVIRRGRADEGGGVIYGVSDEESCLNVNTASVEVLGKLSGMTPDTATAIVNWRGGNSAANAAEAQYYAALRPPYQPRNAPFETVRELLMVRGVNAEQLFGHDIHQNGLLEVSVNGRSEEFVFANAIDSADLGWAGILTVDSGVQNVNAAGDERVNIQSADQTALTGIQGITSQIASAIVAYRGQNRFQSIADLLDVTPPTQNQSRQGGSSQRPAAGDSSSGGGVVSENLLMEIADDLTTSDGNQPGVVNINTASLEVLACLPGMSREIAQAIIAQRQSNGFFSNTAELLKVAGITRQIFKQVAPLVTARSETFRILCEGKVNSSGVRQRIQAIVHVSLSELKTLSWREDDL